MVHSKQHAIPLHYLINQTTFLKKRPKKNLMLIVAFFPKKHARDYRTRHARPHILLTHLGLQLESYQRKQLFHLLEIQYHSPLYSK
jgi:hypothetical protein